MIEIKIPEAIKVGGFDYQIVCNEERDKVLKRQNYIGDSVHYGSEPREISISSSLTPQTMSETITHEFLHCVDAVYNSERCSEGQITGLSNGLLQIFEQLGIRFVKSQ